MDKDIMINTDRPIMPISSMAEALNVHQRTLRIYDSEGILCPKRTDKNRRCYSLDDVERAKLIVFLTRHLSINLAGVKIILKMLEENNIEAANCLEYVKNIATLASIDINVQEQNIAKNSKKGRRAKKTT